MQAQGSLNNKQQHIPFNTTRALVQGSHRLQELKAWAGSPKGRNPGLTAAEDKQVTSWLKGLTAKIATWSQTEISFSTFLPQRKGSEKGVKPLSMPGSRERIRNKSMVRI